MITKYKLFENTISPLWEMIQNNVSFEEIKKDIEAGLYINQCNNDNESPLMFAVFKKNLKLVEYLLEQKADPNIIANDRCSALCYAAEDDLTEICQLLIEYGADVNQYDFNLRTILMRKINSMTEPTVNIFIENTSWSRKDKFGWDILDYLSETYKKEIIKKYPDKYRQYLAHLNSKKFNL